MLGRVFAFVLDEAAMINAMVSMASSVNRVAAAMFAAALGKVFGMVANNQNERLGLIQAFPKGPLDAARQTRIPCLRKLMGIGI